MNDGKESISSNVMPIKSAISVSAISIILSVADGDTIAVTP